MQAAAVVVVTRDRLVLAALVAVVVLAVRVRQAR
jgi:hypothetical protein